MLSCRTRLQSHPAVIITREYRDRLLSPGGVTRVRRRAARRSRRRRGHAAVRLQRRDDCAHAIARSTMRSASYPHAIHYALKANSTLAIARLLRSLGSNADANSGGEIDVALRAGFIPPQIVFTGVGKTSAELAQAIDLGVRSINVESAGEIERIDALSRRAPDTHADRDPGESRHRRAQPPAHFHRTEDQQVRHRRSTASRSWCAGARDLRGRRDRRSAHPRRIADPRPRSAAPGGDGRWSICARAVGQDGIANRAPRPRRRPRRLVRRIARACRQRRLRRRRSCSAVRDSGLQIILEPGRTIVAPAGALLTRVDRRQGAGRRSTVRRDRRRHDRTDPPDALQRVPSDRARDQCPTPLRERLRYRRSAVREQRHARQGSDAGRGPRSAICSPSCDAGAYGSVDGVELQPPAAAGRGAGRDTDRRRVIRRRQTIDDLLALES